MEGLKMADETIGEKAGFAVGFGIAAAQDAVGAIKSAFTGSSNKHAEKAVKNPPTQKAVAKKAVKKAPAKKPAVKKASAKKAAGKKTTAKKSPAKTAAKKSVKMPAKKAARLRG